MSQITQSVCAIDRLKDVAQKQYTMAEAEQGAGKTIEEYKPAHPVPLC